MDVEEFVSAAGERAALGGYVPQFREFAWQAYRALVAGTLEWVRLADPEAQKLDDIQYATLDQLHAYQVKWTIAGNVVSFADFKKLFAGLVSSWQRLRQLGRAAGKQVYGHLLTNKPLSEHDSIPTSDRTAGTFAEFHQQVWLRIQLGEPYDARWQPAVAELCALAGLSEAAFQEFGQFFVLHPAHAGRTFRAERAGHSREDADLTQLFAYLLQQVSDPSRPVELQAGALTRALGWGGRLRTTFDHELVVDQKKYQPLAGPLTALDALLQAHTQGYLFLAGSPGSGKSTLLTEWARTRPERVVRYYAFDFANPSSLQNSDERGDSTQLYFDLVQQLRTEGFYPATVLPHRDLLFLRQTLAAQLQSLGDDFHQTGRRTLLIIDGLDHVPRDYRTATKSFLRDLPSPAVLPEGVYVVLGSQSYELADLPLAVKASWQPDRRVQMEPLGRPEVKRYCAALRLEPPLTPPQQELLWEKSQGHPLYLSYLCERLLGLR